MTNKFTLKQGSALGGDLRGVIPDVTSQGSHFGNPGVTPEVTPRIEITKIHTILPF